MIYAKTAARAFRWRPDDAAKVEGLACAVVSDAITRHLLAADMCLLQAIRDPDAAADAIREREEHIDNARELMLRHPDLAPAGSLPT